MIKRLTKTKKSKQGAILVIVVLILALAMIFIASAMMLTQATRTRLYENTVQSQARLTVTAASEAFIEALQTQEITDDQLDALVAKSLKGPNKNGDKIMMVVDGVPGMSTAKDNCTYLDVYATSASKKDTVYCDFTTIIGTEVENVSIELHAEPKKPAKFDIFNNQIDIGADVGQYNLRFVQGVGMYPDNVTPKNNNIVIRGSTFETASGSVYFSNLLFVSSGSNDAFAYFGGNNVFNGDLIFKDNSYMSTYSSTEAMNGDFFFLGGSSDKYGGGLRMHRAGGWSSISSTSKFVFDKRGVQGSDITANITTASGGTVGPENDNGQIRDMIQKKTCYFIDESGETVMAHSNKQGDYQVKNTGGSIGDDSLNSRYNDYKSSSPGSFPSYAESVFVQINPTNETRVIKTGQKLMKQEYAKLPDGTYKTYNKDYVVKEAGGIEVYAWPLTSSFPTKNYFYDGDGKLMEEEYHQYYDTNDKLKDSVKITLSQGTSGTNPLGKIDNNTTYDSCNVAQVIDLKPGWYQFQPGTVNSAKPWIICLDGNHASEYRLFFKSGNYEMFSLIFAVYNASNTVQINMILESGAKLHLCDEHNRSTKYLCQAGFISVNRDKSTAGTISDYIYKTTRSGSWLQNQQQNSDPSDLGECKKWSSKHKTAKGWKNSTSYQIYYSKYYDGVRKPSIYIYGNGCQIWANSCATVEAYCGLYNGSTFGGEEGKLDGSWPTYIYGRIQTSVLSCGHSQECYCMPYCPQPGGDGGQPDKRAAETRYKIVNIKYYYGISSQTST